MKEVKSQTSRSQGNCYRLEITKAGWKGAKAIRLARVPGLAPYHRQPTPTSNKEDPRFYPTLRDEARQHLDELGQVLDINRPIVQSIDRIAIPQLKTKNPRGMRWRLGMQLGTQTQKLGLWTRTSGNGTCVERGTILHGHKASPNRHHKTPRHLVLYEADIQSKYSAI